MDQNAAGSTGGVFKARCLGGGSPDGDGLDRYRLRRGQRNSCVHLDFTDNTDVRLSVDRGRSEVTNRRD
jgi:hypothetical protein